MGWATEYIDRLKNGNKVSFRPQGRSMEPRINNGDMCTVTPIANHKADLQPGTVVLCEVDGQQYLHIVKEIKDRDPYEYLIGNNKGRINGWIGASGIFGKLTKVERVNR